MRNLMMALLLLLSSAAYVCADSVVDMKLVSVGGYNDGAYYVYPYNFSINDAVTLTPLICDDFNHDVYLGESWRANVYSIADILSGKGQMSPATGSLMAAGSRDQAYLDAAWLYQQLAGSPTQANSISINHTIWSLFADTAFKANSDVTSWLTAATTATSGLSSNQAVSLFSNVRFYTPISGSQSSPFGLPQEFIGLAPVPEPGTLTLLALGLIGLGGVRSHRIRRSKRSETPAEK